MEREVFGVDSGVVTVAHELKAPLCLLRQLALSLEFEQDVRQVSERMVATSERALRQVNDLVKVARLTDALFDMEPVNPRRICDEVIVELDSLFRFNRREVRVDYRNREKLVVGNRDLLHSVVYNFCLNAMNYGGEESPSEVFVRDARGGGVRVGVRDFGPTIPTKMWREIKDGFVKKPMEIAMRPGSSGLGLYIAAKFIDYMHGRFGLVRHRDGTSFYVDLVPSQQTSWL
jgi:signal transduction histidine kinase